MGDGEEMPGPPISHPRSPNSLSKDGSQTRCGVITKRARARCRWSTLSRGERRKPPSPGPYGQFSSRSKVSFFVLDERKKPLMPCSEKRARQLLEKCRAVVHRLFPFTIRLKDRVDGETQPVRIKVDPGSKTTGVAVVREHGERQHVLHLAEIKHRGGLTRDHLEQRSAFRRRRRGANLRSARPASTIAVAATDGSHPRSQAESPTCSPGSLAYAGSARSRPHRKSWSSSTFRSTRILRSPRPVPARHARRIRDAGIPARKVGPHVLVLRQDRDSTPDRAYRPAEPRRDRSRLEPHLGMRAVQPPQGEPSRVYASK